MEIFFIISNEDQRYYFTGGYKAPLDRQLMERVKITNFKGPLLMNRRNEMGGLRVERMQYRRWGGD